MKQHDTNGCYKVRRINQVTRNTWTTVPRHSHINRSHIKHKNTIHRHRLSHHGSYIKPNRSFCPNWKRATKHAQAINCIRIGQKVIKRWSPLRTFNICQITLAEQPQHSKKRIQFEFSSNLSKHSKPKKKFAAFDLSPNLFILFVLLAVCELNTVHPDEQKIKKNTRKITRFSWRYYCRVVQRILLDISFKYLLCAHFSHV